MRADLYDETFMTRGHADSGGLCRAACPLRIVRRGPGDSQVQPSLTIQHLAPNEEVALGFLASKEYIGRPDRIYGGVAQQRGAWRATAAAGEKANAARASVRESLIHGKI